MANHYTYRVEWSTDAEQYMARCMEITGLLASARRHSGRSRTSRRRSMNTFAK
jgi:hypothetical protein